ncbi:MAG: hypothetical protein VX278_13835, partial [Myxococcota bacterium]|nr:hypothetical protein [Myxococcota bacterium]
YPDYGVSWDEPIVVEYGAMLQRYIVEGNPQFVTAFDRYHGSLIPMLLAFFDAWMDDASTRERYLYHHIFNFVVFWIGLCAFFALARKRWGEGAGEASLMAWLRRDGWALCAVLLLFLSPRMFAHSFYNCKDIPFLSFYILALYSGISLTEKPTIRRLFVHALVTALLINIRIMGVLVLVYTGLFLLRMRRNGWRLVLGYGLATLLILQLTWPLLWIRGPWGIVEAIQHMSHFPWKGEVLYRGAFVAAENLPWHYPLVWIAITVPVAYSVLFGLGLWSREWWGKERWIDQWVLLSGALPLVLIIGLGSVIYDGWRHLYFIYPAFLWCSVMGLRWLWLRSSRLGSLFIAGHSLWIAGVMVVMHPFQNVYFNVLAGPTDSIRARYEVDYWGLVYRPLFEDLLAREEGVIHVGMANIAAMYAKNILTPEEQERIRFVSKREKADYFVSNFRWHPAEYPFEKVQSIQVGGIEIGASYRMRSSEDEKR